MSEASEVVSNGGAETAEVVTDGARAKLRGSLGVPGLVFTVIAYNGPLAVVAGFIPLVIGYGNGRGAPATFAVIAALLMVFAVGLVAMSRYMRSPGAFYSYISAGLGRIPGLGGAFVALLAYFAITTGSMVFGGIAVANLVEGTFNGPDVPWWVWTAILLVVSSACSTLNIDFSAKVLIIALSLEVILVLCWQVAVGVDGGPSGVQWGSYTPSAFGEGSLAFGLVFGALCFTGFEAVAVFREETRDPVKTVPRATYLTVAILGTLYSLSALMYLTSFGPADAVTLGATDPAGSFTGSVSEFLGGFAADLISVLLVTSVFAALVACLNITSRYIYTLGSDGVFSQRLGSVHEKHGSPRSAALFVSGLVGAGLLVTALLGVDEVKAYATLTGVGGVCLILLMTATSLAVVAFFRRGGHDASFLQSIVAPVLSLAGLGYILYLCVTNMSSVIGLSEGQARLALLAIVAIAGAGMGLAAVERVRRPDVYARIGRQDL